MPKFSPRIIKIIIIVIVVFVLISAVSSIIQVVYLKRTLSSLPNTLFCSMDDVFGSTLRFRLFNNLDCSDYPGKKSQSEFVPPLKQFQGGVEACNRFPNMVGCQ